MTEQIFTNTKIVLEDRILNGTVCILDGKIHDISETRSQSPRAIDLENDYLMPGLVELHTDNLENLLNHL